jgi:hypothetical protein
MSEEIFTDKSQERRHIIVVKGNKNAKSICFIKCEETTITLSPGKGTAIAENGAGNCVSNGTIHYYSQRPKEWKYIQNRIED